MLFAQWMAYPRLRHEDPLEVGMPIDPDAKHIPDLTLVPRFQGSDPQTLHAQIAAYNSAIATIVKRHSVLLVDLYSRWSELADHPEYISDDGFHPNAIGYTRIAEIFYQVLQEHKQ